jgi:hypothetical protein
LLRWCVVVIESSKSSKSSKSSREINQLFDRNRIGGVASKHVCVHHILGIVSDTAHIGVIYIYIYIYYKHTRARIESE